MKIAFLTYPAAFQNVGGGEILLLKLKEYLEKEGAQVDLFDSWHARVEHYDFIHVFGSVKDCLGLVRVANARRVKVAITPLLWSDLRRALLTDGSLKMKADLLARHLAKVVFPAFPSSRRALLALSDVIFPNSEIEKKQISRLFAISPRKMRVVANGVDTGFLNADPALFRKMHGAEPFILGVGRIEPRKNQLNLIKAVKELGGKKLVLIGSPVSGYESYYEECRRQGEGFTIFLPTIAHQDPLLKSAYAACEVFVLQGWFETPGLVALEAALAGARVASTCGGSTREYFADFVSYFDPGRPSSIKRGIQSAIASPRNERFKNHVLAHYTWTQVAKNYMLCYEEVLAGTDSGS